MIESISIRNFQAHKDASFDFGKITTIVGDSDRGKSAIIRALVWNITNKPNGTFFIRHGANFAEVKVGVDSKLITRCRAKSGNTYTLDGVEFKAIKTDVPDEVKNVYNVSINCIQQQYDSIFWFSMSAGEIAKQLNQIVNLDIIDYTLGELSSKQRRIKGEMDVLEDMKIEQKLKLKNSEIVEALDLLVARVSGFESDLNAITVRCGRIDALIAECSQTDKQMQIGEKILELNNDLLSACSEYLANAGRADRITSLIERLESIGEIDEKTFSVSNGVFERIYNMNQELISKRKNWKRLNSILEDIDEMDSNLESLKKKSREFEEEFHKILNGNKCPLCGRKD